MATPTIIERARTQLIINHAFFASILLKREIVADENTERASINALGEIKYNPEYFESLTLQKVVFVLAHECMHWMMDNFSRQGSRTLGRWNRATDAVNNETLIEAGVGDPPDNIVRWPGAQSMSAEQVYELMPEDDPESDQNGGGSGESPGQDMDTSVTPSDEKEQRQMQAEIRTEIAQAAQAARQMGNMPAALQRMVDSILQPKTPWYERLERFMDQLVKNSYSWSRPNRRFIGQGLYLPSVSGRGMGEMAIIRDTSASVTPAEQRAFAGHISTILEACQPTAIHVLDVSTTVTSVQTFSVDDLPLPPGYKGGGGTDMRVGFDYVCKTLPEVACCVLLTDGETPWPDHVEVPTIVATTRTAAPAYVGETLYIEVD